MKTKTTNSDKTKTKTALQQVANNMIPLHSPIGHVNVGNESNFMQNARTTGIDVTTIPQTDNEKQRNPQSKNINFNQNTSKNQLSE